VKVAERFGANLARERKAAGLSQEQLGFRADLHRTEIGMLERGIRLPRIDTVAKLAGALEIAPGNLLAGIDWTPVAPTFGGFEITDDDATL
jgi:transcriptional regulator with XRE-family HTH domain